MAEPPANTLPHLPGHPEGVFSDFTHRGYAVEHLPNPTKPGIPYPVNMTSQKAAALLNKCAVKSKMAAGKGRPKTGRATIVSHGRKN